MKFSDLSRIKNLIYFTTSDLLVLNESDSKKSLEVSISRWLKQGKLIKLKNGLYITNQTFEKYINDSSFIEFMASRIKNPSYLSTSYVLSKYDVLTEATFGITAVTLKRERSYENKLGSFVYKNITPKLFTGYETKYFKGKEYLVAKKTKALFDYLYFNSHIINTNRDTNIVEDLRLKLDGFTKEDFNELERFADISESPKMKLIIKNIIKNASNY
jgi:predicted transcriptional regulator of viral defense system